VTAPQKAALSLLITTILFGAFAALAFTGLFDLIEARFYNPTITTSMTREVTRNTELVDTFFSELKSRFSDTLEEPAVQRSFLPNQSAEDIFERSRIYGLLHDSLAGLQWVRFIDSAGARIHFSTYFPDILAQDRLSIAYRNYNEPTLPYEAIAVIYGGSPKLTLDGEGDRILFSFPFHDSFDVYRGTAVFSLSVRAVSDLLVREGRLNVGQALSVISNPPGFLSGAPSAAAEAAVASEISSVWREGGLSIARLDSPDLDASLTLLTVRSTFGFFVGRLVDDSLFSFPQTMRVILLLSFFLTVYLTIFLFFNLRQDSVTIVQNRMKKLQISLIEQYYERKSDVDWSRWSRELEQRREEIGAQLKRGIKIASGNKAKDIDTLIDKSWEELLSVIGGRKEAAIDEDKLQLILNRILAAIPGAVASAGTGAQISARPSNVTSADISSADASFVSVSPSEFQSADDAVEVVEEAEPADDLDVLEEIGDAEDAEDATEDFVVEIAEEAEEIVEEIAEEVVEEVEAVEAVETIEEIDAIEEIAEAVEEDVPVIDLSDMNLSASAADEVMQSMASAENVEELEELEELGDLEESTDEAADEAPSSPASAGRIDIAHLASEIEFSPVLEPEDPEDETSHWDDLEIVSPFSMGFSDSDDDEGSLPLSEEPELDDGIEELPEEVDSSPADEVLPLRADGETQESGAAPNDTLKSVGRGLLMLSTKRFFDIDRSGIETLESLSAEEDDDIPTISAVDDDDDSSGEAGVIEEREGVHYISGDALNPGNGADPGLNRDFKNLVDSVVK